MKNFIILILTFLLIVAGVYIYQDKKNEGTFEKFGQKLDKRVEQAGEKSEEVREKLKKELGLNQNNAFEEMGAEIDEKINSVNQELQEKN